MFVKACPNVLPAFAGMDVRAIRQMNVAWKLIEFHPPSLPLFQPINGLSDDLLIHFVDFHTAANSGKQRNCQFSAQMLLKIGKTFQQQRPARRVTLPKLVVPQHKAQPLQKVCHTLVLAGGQTSGQDRLARVERDADRHGLAMVDFIAR
jgi:hypothetical protein